MLVPSLILAVTLIGFALWLQMNEGRGWPEDDASKIDADYRAKRFRRRSRIHSVLIIAGGLIAVAGLAGKGRVWIACWSAVMVLLMVVMMMAIADGYRTRRYLRRRLPEIQREILDDAKLD